MRQFKSLPGFAAGQARELPAPIRPDQGRGKIPKLVSSASIRPPVATWKA